MQPNEALLFYLHFNFAKSILCLDDGCIGCSKRESRMHSGLNHPYIVRYHDSWIETGWLDSDSDFSDADADDHTHYISLELCSRSLEDLLHSCRVGGLPIPVAWNYFRQIALGVEYIQAEGILHADLSRPNILLGTDGNMKIADFGLARPFHPDLRGNGPVEGHLMYIAPEMREGGELGPYTDIYSLGLLLIELICPFGAEHGRKRTLDRLKEAGISDWGDIILYRMIDPSSSTRPTIAQILAITDEAGIQFCEELRSRIEAFGF